jgi:hypothetical protein
LVDAEREAHPPDPPPRRVLVECLGVEPKRSTDGPDTYDNGTLLAIVHQPPEDPVAAAQQAIAASRRQAIRADGLYVALGDDSRRHLFSMCTSTRNEREAATS